MAGLLMVCVFGFADRGIKLRSYRLLLYWLLIVGCIVVCLCQICSTILMRVALRKSRMIVQE